MRLTFQKPLKKNCDPPCPKGFFRDDLLRTHAVGGTAIGGTPPGGHVVAVDAPVEGAARKLGLVGIADIVRRASRRYIMTGLTVLRGARRETGQTGLDIILAVFRGLDLAGPRTRISPPLGIGVGDGSVGMALFAVFRWHPLTFEIHPVAVLAVIVGNPRMGFVIRSKEKIKSMVVIPAGGDGIDPAIHPRGGRDIDP